ncbi:hypothetical protein GUITHDRAFT_132694 [Guillardia theta CCMP2712]|uniref:Suppressor of forked domain-containing protein n=1 Tax=Guillardia theta (strain CCMP2712) TaxID=905079 RepID=L1JZP0_GUITC|nr:hypothetical protein GUITHDRAFT_132694 [Guillardia theta CCMP2712]EKX53588.1 hypothetical protein GUITHDRAFT_132694 [Guillardia theta CCMP2712]|eukprot:XP_005840568.1 hypothetical protein GUITHDRAFT_132694 [Guillardia theta CCMP2712]
MAQAEGKQQTNILKATENLRSHEFMDEDLRESTFGGRLSPLENKRDEKREEQRRKVFRLELSSDSESDSKSRHKKKSKHKSSKSSKRSREKHRSREEEEVRKPKREKIEEVSNYSKISLADLWRKNQVMTMFFDRIGDKANLEYGHPFKLDVPMYRIQRFWAGNGFMKRRTAIVSMLGLPSMGLKGDARGTWRYVRAQQILRLQSTQIKLLKLTAQKDENSQPLKRQNEFISIVDSKSAELSAGESLEDALARRTKEFNVSTRERPNDIQNWLAFVNLQDEFFKLYNRKNQMAITEKKVAILIRALKENPKNEELLVKYLETIQGQLEPEKVQSLWEAVVAKHSNKPNLWRAYLMHRREILETEESMISLLEQLFEFERHAGFEERGLALLQALVEFNCFCPAKFARDESEARRFFQMFWRSEAPRIGEDNAGGFDQWVQQQQQQQQQPQQKETSSAWGEIFTTQSTGQEEEEAEGEGRDLQLPHQESGTEELGANKEDMEEERNGEDRKTGSDSDDKSSEGDSEDASEAESWEGEDVQFCEICTRIKAIVSCVECGNEIHRQTISKHSVMIDMEMEMEMQMMVLPISAKIIQQQQTEEDRARMVQEENEKVQRWFETWVEEEDNRSYAQWQPLKPNKDPEDYELDPDRALLYEDVEPVLFRLLLPRSRAALVKLLMRALRVPLPARCSTQHPVSFTRMYISEEACCPKFAPSSAAEALEGERRNLCSCVNLHGGASDFHNLLHDMRAGAGFLTELVSSYSSLPAQRVESWNPSLFVREGTLRQLGGSWGGEKDLLAAMQIAGNPNSDMAGWPILCKTLLDLELGLGHWGGSKAVDKSTEAAALVILTCVTDPSSSSLLLSPPPNGLTRPNPIALVKTRKAFDALFEEVKAKAEQAPQEGHGPVVDVIGLAILQSAVWFEYFASGVQSAMATFEKQVSIIFTVVNVSSVQHGFSKIADTRAKEGASWAEEECYMGMFSLLMFHSKHFALPPGDMRRFLQRALAKYPCNGIFFRAFVMLEERFGLSHTVRAHWEKTWDTSAEKDPSIPGPPPSIVLEMISFEIRRGCAQRARGVLERALQRAETKHIPLLWRAYMDLEVDNGRPDAAKRVFYRAINGCPGSKAVWLYAFRNEQIRKQFNKTELGEINQMLTSKGLRIRTLLEEVFPDDVLDSLKLKK